ncbi:MAG: DUF5808 domain-containing protein [Candidatus Neomarinimicrobiota bacterium]
MEGTYLAILAIATVLLALHYDASRNWIGGILYVNALDPSIWVERRDGLGFTLNFGQWMAWLWLALLLSIPGFISLLSIFFSNS